jgi:hypothetical protein
MAEVPANALYKGYLRHEVLEAVAHLRVYPKMQTLCDGLTALVWQDGGAADFDETALPSAVLDLLATHRPQWISAKAAVLEEENKDSQEFNVLHNVWVGLKRYMQNTIRLQQDWTADIMGSSTSDSGTEADDAAPTWRPV